MIEGNASTSGLQQRRPQSSTQGPFNTANNVLMFYGGGERAQILETLEQRLRSQSEPLYVQGEEGSGKSMMALVLGDRLKRHYNIVRLSGDYSSTGKLLEGLLPTIKPAEQQSDAGQLPDEAAGDTEAVEQLQALLARRRANGKPILLVLDSDAVLLESARKLLNRLSSIRSGARNALCVVVFQPTVNQTLIQVSSHSESSADETAGPIDNRVPAVDDEQQAHFSLRRLNLAEITEYLQHHMLLFDFNQRNLFSREMSYFIADRSEGVFRAINELARNAFMFAHLEGADAVSMSHLLMAGKPRLKKKRSQNKRGWQVIFKRFQPSRRAWVLAATLVVSLSVLSAGAFLFELF